MKFLRAASLILVSLFFSTVRYENLKRKDALSFAARKRRDSRKISCTAVIRKFTVLFDSVPIAILHTINLFSIFHKSQISLGTSEPLFNIFSSRSRINLVNLVIRKWWSRLPFTPNSNEISFFLEKSMDVITDEKEKNIEIPKRYWFIVLDCFRSF